MASREINDLRSDVSDCAIRHKNRCAEEGIDLLIYCTLRDAREQAKLFRQGRTPEQIEKQMKKLESGGYRPLAELLHPPAPISGKKVTFAGPGQSYHQYGLAYDCVPLVNGKCLWSTTGDAAAIWRRCGELGEAEGLEWSGNWSRCKEFPHFQKTGGKSIPELMEERYRDAQASSVLTAADLSTDSESEILRKKLDEPNSKFFILASLPGIDNEVLARIYTDAVLASNLNPAVRRVFWIKNLPDLSSALKNLLWGDASPSVATVLATDTGMSRQAKNFSLSDIETMIDITLAFSWEP